MDTGLILLYLPIFFTSSPICIANSLVGAKIKTWGSFSSHLIFSTNGITKDAVLPVPVLDFTTTSLLNNISGITFSWTDVVYLYPKSNIASFISLLNCNLLKSIWFS